MACTASSTEEDVYTGITNVNVDQRFNILDNAIQFVGNTPLVYVNNITKDLPAKIGTLRGRLLVIELLKVFPHVRKHDCFNFVFR